MPRRRKRIPYDPPAARKRRGKRQPWRRADQIFLTRRVLLMKSAIVAAFMTLVARLGYMQIIKGEHYSEQSRRTTTTWVPERPPRGMILDRAGRALAENRRVWEVRVIPSELPPRDSAEFKRVRSTLITALRLPEVLVVNPNAVPRGAEETVYARIARLLGYSESEKIERFIADIKREARYNYLVAIDWFTPDQAPKFRAVTQELPGVEVINRFDYLVRNVAIPDLPVVIKRDVSREIALVLEANRLSLPGVQLDDSALVRTYPGGEVVSHILGYVGRINEDELNAEENQTPGGNPIYRPDDIIGKHGVELTMEKLLRGSKGGRLVEVDDMGFEVRTLYENPPVPGRNLRLTIDLELQAAASRALEEGIRFSNEDRTEKDRFFGRPPRKYSAGAGAVVALDPRNGEVLALVSYPNYDNQLFVEGISQRKFDEYRDEKANKPLVNRAASDHFAPGSTVKLFVALAALKEKIIDEHTTFTCTSGIWVPHTWDESKGDRYLCWLREGGGHGTLDLLGGIEQSCDVYFYNVGTPQQRPEGATRDLHYRDLYYETGTVGDLHYFKGLGIRLVHKYLTERFWFGEPTRIELPVEAAGLVPNPQWKEQVKGEGWSAGDTINTTIGQGDFLASPLQLAVNVAAIANGGTIYRPRLIDEIVDDQQRPIQAFESEVLRRLKLDPAHLRLVRQGMWRVVNSETGTAHRTPVLGTGGFVTKWPLTNPEGEEPIIIAGKTGTAEVGAKNPDGTHSEAHAWFTCYAPYDEPEIVVVVFVEKGGEGSSYAVPIADRVLRAYFELTGRRERGLVLRQDGQPIGERTPAPGQSSDRESATPEVSAPETSEDSGTDAEGAGSA